MMLKVKHCESIIMRFYVAHSILMFKIHAIHIFSHRIAKYAICYTARQVHWQTMITQFIDDVHLLQLSYTFKCVFILTIK